ncbi:FIST C-terminal domain-containing protein [Egibacter rhizosphaerae]|uniref:FIST C-terminal domain-containing protein n=1 Tax=Egibacter rhizosphaerae TaxID=1670831 RepID=UPI0013F1485E|nr:FIST C-terminal domain-containing protein [Egibacter rhizosphaerae]
MGTSERPAHGDPSPGQRDPRARRSPRARRVHGTTRAPRRGRGAVRLADTRPPLGLPTLDGTFEVRMVQGATDDGGLEMFSYVHDQSIVRLMGTDATAMLDGARTAVRRAVERLGGEPRAVLVFSCAARAALLGEEAPAEATAVSDELEGVDAVGWFTSGEYALTTGATGFHNATVAVLAL